jgi:diadenosine tetraphosphate (Ap4A) HIT family hydrolase
MKSCPFCTINNDRLILEEGSAYSILDGFPVSRGHALIIPKRHVGRFQHLNAQEKADLLSLLEKTQAHTDLEFSPDGYNIGINDGAQAGQTIPHLHIHLIPRYAGDLVDPRGGVRWVLPDKAKYWD